MMSIFYIKQKEIRERETERCHLV